MSSWTNTAAREFLRPYYYCPGIADRLSVDRSGDVAWIPLQFGFAPKTLGQYRAEICELRGSDVIR